VPDGLESALGQKMGTDRAIGCFKCHTTAAVTSMLLESEKAKPGVTCVACHGPGVGHIVSMTANYLDKGTAILNPANLSPSDSVDFCGACHSTWADVMEAAGTPGPGLIRFQPYWLEESRCWGQSGNRPLVYRRSAINRSAEDRRSSLKTRRRRADIQR
jgi:hypothetical protein